MNDINDCKFWKVITRNYELKECMNHYKFGYNKKTTCMVHYSKNNVKSIYITNKSRSRYKNVEGKFFCIRFDRSEEGFSSYNLYKLHKKNGYKYVTCDYYTDNKIVYRTYSKVPVFPSLTGVLHRSDDGPSVIDKCFGDINYNKRLVWYKDGFMHRGKDLPAEIYLDKTGFQVEKLWYLDNKYHRENGPCHISYSRNENGEFRLIQCFFCENGSYNRKKFPSYYNFTDDKITMKWYENDMLHREDGPAYLVLDRKTMEPIKEEFYLRGNEIDEFKFEIMKVSKKS